MRLISILVRASWRVVALSTAAALLSGGGAAALVALTNAALRGPDPSKALMAAAFAGLCAAVLVTRAASRVWLVRLAQDAVFDLRLSLTRRILSAPLRQLEEVGAPRLLAALTDDVLSISEALPAIPSLGVSFATVVGCLAYLGWLSTAMLLVLLAVLAAGAAAYRLVVARSLRAFARAREEQDALFTHFRALTEGIKELKLHHDRREAFLSQLLEPTALAFRRHAIAGRAIYSWANSWVQVLFFIVIGVLVFAAPAVTGVPAATVTAYTLTFFYMTGPLDVIMSWLPFLGRANVAVRKVETLGLSLAASGPEEGSSDGHAPAPVWTRLELAGVAHAYHREREDRQFVLGPIDLAIRPGELVFLVGGNGSGKTTLAKLLAGLYAPERGEIRLDGEPVTDETRARYREQISAVFSDGFLFDRLLGLSAPDLDARARDYLARLQLDHTVGVEGGAFTTTALSQGQRKRLALLAAYLEDRPVYLFDEWASDQDPLFKEVFYTRLLPDLRARGKGVVVITHDDRYYGVADRIVKLEDGRIVQDGRAAEARAGTTRPAFAREPA